MADRLFANDFWKIRTEAPGAPEPLIREHFVAATRDFFHRSRAWRYETGILPITAGQAWPTVTPPANTYVVEPLSVTWYPSGQNVPFKARDWLDTYRPNWQTEQQSGPTWWTKANPGEYQLVPRTYVDVPEALRLRVALSITETATGIPEELFYEYIDSLIAGALLGLLKMRGKDWFDVEMAAIYAQSFEEGIVRARSRADNDSGRPTRTVRYGGI